MKPAPRPPGTKQILFPLGSQELAQSPLYTCVSHVLCKPAHRPFLPLGLFVWGATADTYVEAILVGNQHEASLPCEPIPALYFAEGRSMLDLQRLADSNELELSVEQRRVIEMEVAETGQNITVRMTGPFDNVCLWGLTYAQRWPQLTQVIEHVQKPVTWGIELGDDWDGFRGRVIEHHLGGDRVISNVYAPSEQSVCRLLSAARSPARMY
jgi:hypothetical protein